MWRLVSIWSVTGALWFLVGFAGTANASATVDLIWIDITDTDTDGKPICLQPANRNCPQLGSTISNVAMTDNITLGVIITAGPGSILAVGVDVDYNDTLPKLSVTAFQSLITPPYLPTTFPGLTNDTEGWVEFLNAIAVTITTPKFGIGLPAGATAYLGTVTFHKDASISGTHEIAVGVDGPTALSDVLRLDGAPISGLTTFNSAFLVNIIGFPTPSATPTATPSATPAATPTATPTPTSSKKVTVCHNGKRSINASSNAVSAHLAHGDTLGACP